MPKKMLRFVIIIFFLVGITSCGQNNAVAEEVIIGLENVEPDEINTRLQIAAPESWNTFKIGDTIALIVENHSDQQVRFIANDDTRIFIETANGEWVETQNNLYETLPFIDVWPEDENPFGTITLVFPEISHQETSTNIRIIIVAVVYQDGLPTSKTTGAYIDLTLRP